MYNADVDRGGQQVANRRSLPGRDKHTLKAGRKKQVCYIVVVNAIDWNPFSDGWTDI